MSNKVELLYLIKSLFDELYEIEDYIQKARRKRTRRKKAGDKRPPAHWFYEKVYTFMKRGMPKENAIRLAAWIWYHRAGRKAKQKHKRLAKQKKYQRRASRYKALISRVGRRKGKRKSSLDLVIKAEDKRPPKWWWYKMTYHFAQRGIPPHKSAPIIGHIWHNVISKKKKKLYMKRAKTSYWKRKGDYWKKRAVRYVRRKFPHLFKKKSIWIL